MRSEQSAVDTGQGGREVSWSVRLTRWQATGWAWDLCSDDGQVLLYRTGRNGAGLYARRPADATGKRWTWACLDPHAWWPADRAAMRRAVLRHYGL